MAKTNTGLVAYAKAMLGKPYWYGTFGQIGSEALYKSKKNQYPSYYVRSNYTQGWEHQYGQRVHDCVGLIKGYLWSDTTTSTPKYNSAQDVSANGMLNKCKEKGAIGTIPELPGVLVFYPGHVGVYEGNGNVIEAMGHSQGVVRTKLKDRPWKNWGKCPWIDYSASEKKPTVTATVKKKTLDELAKEVIAGKWGTGAARQNAITEAYKAGKIDYGYATIQKRVNEMLKADSDAKTVKVGSKVKIKSGAKSYEGKKVSLFVYLKTYTVDELKGDRAVLNKKGICTAFNVKDLIVQ